MREKTLIENQDHVCFDYYSFIYYQGSFYCLNFTEKIKDNEYQFSTSNITKKHLKVDKLFDKLEML